MSWHAAFDPVLGNKLSCNAIETVIVPRTADLGGFTVKRALPSAQRRMVGPFIFFDQAGPAEFLTGQGMDVRPHPHIGLSTVTYLFTGEIMHRDSLGTEQAIKPGDLNWMTAGSGIVHSERTGQAQRQHPHGLFGLQAWVALPKHLENGEASFTHHAADELPVISGEGKTIRIIAGSAFGQTSPVKTGWDTIYADAILDIGASLPLDANQEERAIWIATGAVQISGDDFEQGHLLVFKPGDTITITATQPTRLLILGGAVMDGPRHIWWNFVSSSKERIDQAKEDWRQGRFDTVPNDSEFIPLPES